MARSAASTALLCLAAAACLLRGASASVLLGSAAQGEQQLACATAFTCGTLQNLAFEGYAFAANQSDSTATCLCMDGRRVVASGAPADPSLDFQQADGPLMSRGCWANMTWSLAAPFVAACRGDALAGGACSPACAVKLAPFNRDCFHGVLSEDYFQTQPGQQPPTASAVAAFYDACFPPPTAAKVADAPQQQKAPAMSAAGAGAVGVSSGAAPAGGSGWALLAAALAAAALLVA